MKPVTPLPWISAAIGRNDHPYMLHACNAYPRLVAALEAMVKAEIEYGDPMNVAINEAWASVEWLLRELGETQ